MSKNKTDSSGNGGDATRKSNTNPSGIAGKISLGADVVEKIAGLVAREIPGIHSIGKSSIIPFGDKDRRGVDAEVGEIEAAVDLEAVIIYGVNVEEVVGKLRTRLAEQIKKMTGREVIEVNVKVVGIHLPEGEQPAKVEERRVR
jgi:uncharacterized alkaline shock family protein YloU